MPSDQPVFDEFKLPFIFVPHGAPEPTDWLQRHPDYIKLPATMVPRARSSGRARPSPPNPSFGQRWPVDGLAASSDPAALGPPTGNAMSDAGSTGAKETPDLPFVPADPIAAYLVAEAGLATAASSYVPGSGDAPPSDVDARTDLPHHADPREPASDQARIAASQGNQNHGTSWQGEAVLLPNGRNVLDPESPTGNLMSPVADLSVVAAAGRDAGAMYRSLLSNPDTAPGALPNLLATLDVNLGHGGTFDYQRQGNLLTGYTQLRQFKHVSNVNVGLFAQQAGLTLDEALTMAGGYAGLLSSNARPDQPHRLDPTAARFITEGFNIGQSGVYSQPSAP